MSFNRYDALCKKCGIAIRVLVGDPQLCAKDNTISSHEKTQCYEDYSSRTSRSNHPWTDENYMNPETAICRKCGRRMSEWLADIRINLMARQREVRMGKCCLICGIFVLLYYEMSKVTPKETTEVAICSSCVAVLKNMARSWRGQSTEESIDENWSSGWVPE